MPVTRMVPWRVRAAVQRDACETCGSTSQLGLHHMDEDRTNNSPENLQTLCQSCHTSWHWANGKEPWRRREPTCTVCGRPSRHLGLCPTHRSRLRRHGSPYLRKIKAGSTWLWLADSGPQSGRVWDACPTASLTGWTDLEPSETPSFPRSRSGSASASSPTSRPKKPKKPRKPRRPKKSPDAMCVCGHTLSAHHGTGPCLVAVSGITGRDLDPKAKGSPSAPTNSICKCSAYAEKP